MRERFDRVGYAQLLVRRERKGSYSRERHRTGREYSAGCSRVEQQREGEGGSSMGTAVQRQIEE